MDFRSIIAVVMLEGFGFYSDSGCYGDTTPLSCLIKVEIIIQSDVTKLKGIITGLAHQTHQMKVHEKSAFLH